MSCGGIRCGPSNWLLRARTSRREQLQQARNRYLAAHPRAQVAAAQKAVQTKIAQLKIQSWLQVTAEGRSVQLTVNQAALEDAARLDGCYVIQTDLPASAASKQVVHDRYKDLAQVEQAFGTCKTAHLETRPIYVRTAEHTRGHVLVVILAYLIRRAWTSLDVTVEEGLQQLQTLCSTEIKVQDGGSCLRIPTRGRTLALCSKPWTSTCRKRYLTPRPV